MNEINVKVELITAVSAKTQNKYEYLLIKYPNGFEQKLFMNADNSFAIKQNFKK